MIRRQLKVDVVQAAKNRILDLFNKHEFLIIAFSGGKDSIIVAELVFQVMDQYKISGNRIVMEYFDEEAIYPDIEQSCLDYRRRVLDMGGKFHWWCLPIKHYNCVNQLANDESFICFEKGKEDVWVRPMPDFAIREHSLFKHGMTYQDFADVVYKGLPIVTGVRGYESIQRLKNLGAEKNIKVYKPIYDWRDSDVWKFLKDENIPFPITYLHLYKVGVPLQRLRISQFFSIDTIATLPKVLEFYPNLYEAILKREPNVDLAMMYHETDMFRSSRSSNRNKVDRDYKKLIYDTLEKAKADKTSFPGIKQAKWILKSTSETTPNNIYQSIYQVLIAGDPKNRTTRMILGKIKRIK